MVRIGDLQKRVWITHSARDVVEASVITASTAKTEPVCVHHDTQLIAVLLQMRLRTDPELVRAQAHPAFRALNPSGP